MFSFFFLEFKRKETNPEIKKNNQSRYNRFLRNCSRRLRSCLSVSRNSRVSGVSDAMEKDYIIFSQNGRRTKSRKTSEKNAGQYNSGEICKNDYCN